MGKGKGEGKKKKKTATTPLKLEMFKKKTGEVGSNKIIRGFKKKNKQKKIIH